MKLDTVKLTFMALFAVIALIIFIIEAQIPLPVHIPGLKLGLANIVTLFMLFLGGRWKTRDVFMVLAVRILLGALFAGQPVSFLYSAAGGMLSLVFMYLLKTNVRGIPLPVVSVAGAIAHNIGQIAMVMLVWQSTSVMVYLPVLIAGGIVSGLVTGFCIYFIYKFHPNFTTYISDIRR